MIIFDVQGEPKGQPRPRAFKDRGGNVRVYTPGTAENWKSQIACAAKPVVPFPPLDGPLQVEILFRFPRPKAQLRKNGEVKPDAPHWKTGKPDVDNLCKGVLDCLMDIGVFGDDSQIAVLITNRTYHQNPGATIRIQKLSEAL